MTFKTDKNKIKKIWNDSAGNQFEINVLSDNDKIILSKTKSLNRTSTVYKNIIDFSSDWLIPGTRIRDDIGYEGSVYRLFKEYTIEINGINKNFIPFIDSKVVYRLGDSVPSAPVPSAPFYPGVSFDEDPSYVYYHYINNITEIKPSIEDSNDLIKNITYINSVYLYRWDTGLPKNLQIKFYISLINPNYYQST